MKVRFTVTPEQATKLWCCMPSDMGTAWRMESLMEYLAENAEPEDDHK